MDAPAHVRLFCSVRHRLGKGFSGGIARSWIRRGDLEGFFFSFSVYRDYLGTGDYAELIIPVVLEHYTFFLFSNTI